MTRIPTLYRSATAVVLACLAVAVAMAPSLGAAEVVVVLSSDKGPYVQAMEGIRSALAPLGHTVQVMKVDDLDAGKPPLAAAHAIAVGTQAAIWLRDHPPGKATTLYCMVSDPEMSGVAGMRGITTDIPLAGQVALIAEALPAARTVGVLYRGDLDRGRHQLDEFKRLLPATWKLVSIAVDQHQGSANAIDALFAENIDVVWTAPDTGVYTEAVVRTLLLTALRRRVPVFGFSHAFVRAGGLFGVGINPTTQGTQAAGLLQRLIAEPGNQAAEPPCVPPAFEIAVNLVVAQKLSLELPKDLVRRAAQTYQPGR